MSYTNKVKVSRFERWLPLLVAAVGIVAYSNSFSGPFIFDDYPSIVRNQGIRTLFPISLTTRWVTNMTFRLNYAVSGLNCADYHVVNLVIHLGAALFLLGIVRRTLLLPRFMNKYGSCAGWLGAAVAAIWVAHPLQTESVAYVCQRYESIMGLFFLGIVYAFVRGVSSARPRWWFNLAILLSVVAMGTKVVIFVCPAVLLAYDYLFVAESAGDVVSKRWKVHLALWLTVLVGAFLWLNGWSLPAGQFTANTSEASPFQYLMTQSKVIVRYLRLSLIPFPLCFDYGWTVVESWREIIWEGLVVSGAFALTICGLLQRKKIAFLGIWWFAILAPTSSFVPVVDVIVEHRLYLPLAAVCVGAVLGLHEIFLLTSYRRRTVVEASVVLAILALFVSVTLDRIGTYRTEEAMWWDVVGKAPNNARGRLGLAVSLAGQNRNDEAKEQLQKLLDLLPSDHRDMTEKERTIFARACANEGFILFGEESYGKAEACFRQALAILPRYALARNNLGLCLRRQGKGDEAVEQWLTSREQDPSDVAALNCLGSFYMAQGRHRAAVDYFEESLKHRSDMAAVALDLAWILSTSDDDSVRNGDRAVELLFQVMKSLGSQNVSVLDVMGMAKAESGRFAEAIEWAERAVIAAEVQGMDPAEIEARIELYRNSKAYRIQKEKQPR